MVETRLFGDELSRLGFNLFTGIPCSFLKSLINYAINSGQYYMSTNEGDAVAFCAGANLAGQKPVLLMQNSGLSNAVSPLTSLNYVFRIPVLGFVSLRGEQGLGDEPQHELLGQITGDLLSLMKVEWEYLEYEHERAIVQIQRANQALLDNKPFFFIVKKNTFSDVLLLEPLSSEKKSGANSDCKQPNKLIKRREVLRSLRKLSDGNTVLLATTGYTGRELYQIKDDPSNFYMVGSMGCVSSIALGLSCVKPGVKVVAVDGDAALLMRMGSMATNAYYCPSNMLHILLDNHAHESTGSQATVSSNLDWINLAHSTGYPNSIYIHNIQEFEEKYVDWQKNGGMTFMYIETETGTFEDLVRPKIKPYEVKERLMEMLEKPYD